MKDLKLLRVFVDRLIDNIDESTDLFLEERNIICKQENFTERKIMNLKREQVLVAEAQRLCQNCLKSLILQRELNIINASQMEIFQNG